MKRLLLIVMVCIFGLVGCTNKFKDIKVTSCVLEELTPLGLSSVEVKLTLGVHNPAAQFTLSDVNGTIKFGNLPYLLLKSEDVTVKGRTDSSCSVVFLGTMTKDANPFVIVSLLKKRDFSRLKADFSAHITLEGGIGKDIELKDISLEGLVDRI